MRHTMTALALASGIVVALEAAPAHAQTLPDGSQASATSARRPNQKQSARKMRNDVAARDVPARPASDITQRTAVPPDLDQRRRDGHMTPDERRLLRQHIEDAVRELYKR
ncbi:hypothetical protein E1956_10280 [Paraburkholderia pallida]|uniref:DUF4148 domain-containing protein n=2 Tax=Paraburkholderia pallida TaxID=2547399 RepID=A0A4P7CNW3_9BURK|nr:hypothetical protein E1956_10280 [Paraburkholderia pallida]